MKSFRIVAYAEGVSFLVLLGIAMPLKYAYGMPQAVKIVGMVHGVLFLAYIGFLAWLASENSWPLKRVIFGFIASVLPFGPFVFDASLHRWRS
jgi:integral membrane protein